MKFIYLLIISTLLSISILAQDRDIDKMHHEKRHEIAHNLVNQGSYFNAIEHLEKLVKEHPQNKKYLIRLAEAYSLSRDYVNAEKYFLKAKELDPKYSTYAQYKYAESLKSNGKYNEALAQFKEFASSKYKDYKGTKYKLWAEQEIISTEWALNHLQDSVNLKLVHLGDSVNSKYSDFSPIQVNDSTFIFASIQADSVLTYSFEETHFFHTKLYQVSMTDSFQFKNLKEVKMVNSEFENNANGSLSPDGKSFYFSRCFENLKNQLICNIYVCKVDSLGNLGKPQKMNSGINRSKSSNSQPFSTLHKTDKGIIEVLYFSSNRNGGKGGFDIWVSTKQANGTFRTPQNLGSEINSSRDEVTPYFDMPTGLLYFSSNFHPGYGGFDIFSSKGQLSSWSSPHNLGKPYNSSADDVYFNFGKKNKGFVVSNRVGGYSLKSATCCDDIYGFQEPRHQVLLVHSNNADNYAQLAGVKEIVKVDNQILKPLDRDKYYFLYDRLAENEIYFVDNTKQYEITIADSLNRILASFSGEMKDKFEISLYEKQNQFDSISITENDDPRFDIHIINLFKSFKDTSKTDYKSLPQNIVEIKDTIMQNFNPVVIKNIEEKTVLDILEMGTSQNISKTDTIKENIIKENVVKENITNESIVNENIIKEIAKKDTIQKAISSNDFVVDETKEIKETHQSSIIENSLQLEKKTVKVTRIRNVKKCEVYSNNLSEISTISNSKLVDTITSTLETSFLKVTNHHEPDIKMVVHYGFNEESFLVEHKEMLDSIARFLAAHPHIILDIEAHTDDVGSEQFNLDLSYKRAKTLANYFAHKGISRTQLNTKWHGESKPKINIQNQNAEQIEKLRQSNRRAELKFYGVKKKK